MYLIAQLLVQFDYYTLQLLKKRVLVMIRVIITNLIESSESIILFFLIKNISKHTIIIPNIKTKIESKNESFEIGKKVLGVQLLGSGGELLIALCNVSCPIKESVLDIKNVNRIITKRRLFPIFRSSPFFYRI